MDSMTEDADYYAAECMDAAGWALHQLKGEDNEGRSMAWALVAIAQWCALDATRSTQNVERPPPDDRWRAWRRVHVGAVQTRGRGAGNDERMTP